MDPPHLETQLAVRRCAHLGCTHHSSRPDRGHVGRWRLRRAVSSCVCVQQLRPVAEPEASIKDSVGGVRMTYRLQWCLVGRAGRHLDSGEIDEAFPDPTSALQALNAFLLTFAVRGRNEAEGYWWGRRSADADIELQVVLRHPVLPTNDAPAPLKLVASQEASSDLLLKPATPRGGENDIRRPDVTLQGRRGPQRAECAQAAALRRLAR